MKFNMSKRGRDALESNVLGTEGAALKSRIGASRLHFDRQQMDDDNEANLTPSFGHKP